MIDTQQVARLIAEAGPLDDDIVSVVQTGEGIWTVRYEHVAVDLELDADAGRLVLSAEIAAPPADRRAAAYEALLSYSLLWRETGGVRMALAGPDGSAVQMVDLNIAELTPTLLATVLANLVDRTLVWRAFFVSGLKTESRADSLADQGIRI